MCRAATRVKAIAAAARPTRGARFLPGSGWVEFDPTNGIVGNRDLIRVAVARDARQAIPLHGFYYGKVEDEEGMEVSVTVRRLPDLKSPSNRTDDVEP